MSFCISKDCNLRKDTLQFLYEKYGNENSTKIPEVFGGILSNLHYAWLVRKSRIVVVNSKNALRVGSWDFGNTLQDDTVEINNVEEIQRPNGKEPHLIISLNCETRGGLICIFDFVGSKVIRAIQIVDNITSVHVIDRGQDLFSLSGPLRNFDGVLAVGTVGGNVYILDICRQLCYEGFNSFEARDELNPCQMKIITASNLLDLENYKKIALCSESHLAIFLNVVQNKKTEHFVLKGPGGSDVLYVNKEEVLISSLHYCPQLSSILVGYNFGAFQLWDLMNMELVYTSPVCEDHTPIIKFAIQEPADDPRAFCYVWAVYSTEDLESKVLPNLVMYALCFKSKEFHENYGVLYENFQYCTVRYQRELGFGNNNSNIKPIGGKCINLDCLVLKNSSTTTEVYGNDGTDDALSLCVVGWKAVCESGQFVYMTVFDLNQWYKAQMPNSSNFDDCSSYMITLCISDLTNSNGENTIDVFDVNLHKKTIQQFIGTQRLEEHYYPSSLSFETSCLVKHKIVNIQYQGVQQALLGQLQRAGPLCLIRPSETYQEIVTLGLTPLFVELNTSAITSLNNQREVILSVALEHQLISWLCKCASEWANGSFSSAGCSLELLISWAHRRAVTLKSRCDDLCIPLFDYSDIKLDTNTINVLSNCIRQIKNISYIFFYILDKFSSYLSNKDAMSGLCNRLKMVELYFDVLQWFFNIGLLPEFTLLDQNLAQEDKVRAPYPVKDLEEYYMKRRSELLLAVNKRLSMRKSVLFIDNLISFEFGDQLEKDWKKDGGNGFYPPRSIQALLRSYLLEEIEVCNKHSLIIYLLSDLAVVLDSQYQPLITNLMKFPAVFKVSPSFIKITHAFWQLDHGGFHHAMEQLLDPMVNQEDLKNWHHKVALKSLLVQEQHNLALLYMNVRKPPVVDDEDVLCGLSLFISNNMLDEAFYLEKNFSNYSSSKNIIKHLFAECSNYGRLNSIIYRNLTPEEEAQFLNYLDEVKHPEAADLKITYFMQRSHYKEAFNTYKACEDDPTKRGLISRLNLKARDQIVHSYKKFLPTVSYDFIESCTREPNPVLWKEVSRPDPMSVSVHKADTKTEYKSSMILAALAKAKLTFNESVPNVSLLNATTEEIPFLRTPTAPLSHKRSSVQVIIPQIVEDEAKEEEDGPSPSKRLKLSITSPHKKQTEGKSSILTTPIIVRKVRSYVSPIERHAEDVTSTPISILKVRDSYQKEMKISSLTDTSTTPSRTIEHKSFVSGRKPTRASIVRFDVPSSSPEEQSSSLRSSARDVRTPERNESISFENTSKSVSHSITPKNNSDTDDVFYSPNSSLNNIEELPEDLNSDEKELTEESPIEPCLKISPQRPAVISKAERVKLVDYNPSSSDTSASSPKGRRSYRKLESHGTAVRSSPRLSKSRDSTTTESERTGSDQTIITENSIPSSSFSSMGKSRKSLNRRVLEANTLSRLAKVASTETTRTEIFKEEKKISSMVIDDKKSEISHTRIEYADSYTKESSSPEKIVEKHSISTSHSYTAETTLDSDNSESINKFDDFVEMRVPHSFSNELDEDLRNQPIGRDAACRLSTDSNDRKDLASDVTLVRSSTRQSKGRDSAITEKDRTGRDRPLIAEEFISSPSICSTSKSRKSLNRQLSEANTLDSYKTRSSIPEKISEKHSLSTSDSFMAETTMDSQSSESVYKFDESIETGVSDSFLAELEEDLRKRQSRVVAAYRQSEHRGNTKGNDTEKTPSRRRRTSSRISERTSSFASREKTPENEGKSTVNLEHSVNLEEKKDRTLVEETKLSIETHIVSKEDDKSEKGGDHSQLPKESSSFKSSPLLTSSSKKLLGVNPTKKSNRPLSRRVLENNALSRIISEYSTSSNEEMEVDKPEETAVDDEMLEDNIELEEKQNDISVSDSVLELIAFGKLSREKELLEKRGKSLPPMEKLEPFEPVMDAASEDGVFEKNPDTSFVKQSTSVPDHHVEMIPHEKSQASIEQQDPVMGQFKDDATEIPETSTNVEAERENMSHEEVCGAIYDDLDDEIEQNNLESNTCDDAMNQGMLEHSSSGSESISRSDQLRQETVTPTAFERNIFGSHYSSDNSCDNSNKSSKPNMEVIEILSSDSSESQDSTDSSSKNKSSTSNDSLDEDILEHDNVTQKNDNVERLDLIADSNIDEDKNKKNNLETATTILSSESKSDENTNEGEKEIETEQTERKEDIRNKPERRITRRSSKLLDEQDNAIENKTNSLTENEDAQNVEVPKRNKIQRGSISRRSSQGSSRSEDPTPPPALVNPVSEQPQEIPRSISARKRPRSVDVPLNTEMEDNNATTSKKTDIHRGRRKLRSASVDIPTTIDEELNKESHVAEKSKKKPSSISGVDDVKREKKVDKKSSEAVKEELVENYRKGRRLTRSQSNILEKSISNIDLSSLATQDSIELLDKSEFKGTPDPQEQKVYEISPSSSASAPRSNIGRPARRVSRASSNVSDDSVTSSISATSRTKSSVTHVDSPTPRVTRRKLRSASEENSESISPEKVKDKASDIVTDDSGESDTSIISTRSRKSNTKSDSNNSSKTRKRKIVTKSALPEIREENTEVTSGSPAQNTRRGRKNVQK